jgi:ubiquinol-cytochrome c reductase cytochrome b subunit
MSVWRRAYEWLDLRMDIRGVLHATLFHPVPRDVNWWYVLGSATLTSFIVQVVTGVALAFAYVPSTEHAYSSLDFITNQAFLGSVVRGMHFWGATAMVLLILAHMTRVFLFGSFKFPREISWLSGSLLLLLTLAMAFTGQLLRWDQDSFWGIVVLAEQVGKTPLIGPLLAQLSIAGQQVGAATLTRFFATHVFLIPAGIFLLIGVHLYLVVRRGISDPPTPQSVVVPNVELDRYERVLETRGVPFFPDVAWRDFAASAGLVVLLLVLAGTTLHATRASVGSARTLGAAVLGALGRRDRGFAARARGAGLGAVAARAARARGARTGNGRRASAVSAWAVTQTGVWRLMRE